MLADCPAPPPDAVPVVVAHVTDGDTFSLDAPVFGMDTVRLVGVDTPETVDPDEAPEPGGAEASAFTKDELTGERLLLAPAEEPRDPYGRLLAYAWTPDGDFFNARLLREGHAEVMTIPPNDQHRACFESAAKSSSGSTASGLLGWLLGWL